MECKEMIDRAGRWKVAAGVSLIVFSYLAGWPMIGLLGYISASVGDSAIVSIGGPLTYIFSYFILFAGVYLAGAEHTARFMSRYRLRPGANQEA